MKCNLVRRRGSIRSDHSVNQQQFTKMVSTMLVLHYMGPLKDITQ